MFKKILIPIDVGIREDAQGLLRAAKTLTADWPCERHVITVIPHFGMSIVGSYFDKNFESQAHEAAQTQLAAAVAEAGLEAHEQVLTGTIYDGVISHASHLEADLIIIGAHQPELRDYLLGANAARVVRHSRQSVLVLRDLH